MNGAKARSQSFSSNNIEKPNINTHDGPAKIRTQFITSSGERGSSLSRQNSLEVQSAALSETPVLSPRSRVTHYGGMTGSNIPERIESISNVDGTEASPMGTVTSPSFVELRNLPGKAAKVSSHAQFKPPPFSVNSSQNQGDVPHDKEVKPQKGSPDQGSELEEKRTSTTACTIEEKVMLGIKENAQKCQEQEKIAASESKQKTGPSLANWFGLRKSKLPSLSGKKADSTKAKDEKKELKMASVLGGKSDKKKERKKGENQQTDGQEGQNLSEMNNKLSSIIDHCNNQMGQIANQIQCTTAFIGKDQFVRELFGRASKCNCVSASPPGVPGVKKHAEICPSSATLLMTQKINLAAEIEEELIPDTACQDHMIGSSCQMRTLDSGIGTFPLPDSVTRISARSIPKSESSPESVTSSLTEEPPHSHLSPLSPDVKVSLPPKTITHAPSSMGHSQSDHSVTSSSHAGERRTHLPKLANSDAIKTKRSSLVVLRSSVSMEDKGKETQRSRTTEQDVATERALQVSSNTDAEPDGISSSQRTLVYRTRRNDSVEQSCESRKNPEKTPSIMDYCHLEKDGRRISQHALLHRDDEAANRLSEASEDRSLSGSATFSLDTLNKLNHGSSRRGSGLYLGGKASDEPSSFSRLSNGPGPEPEGSLYDSFSSCTSQGSNNV
ncbi:nck-associated protein 5-like [Takifugu rubripes]|uniref:nck-associated protein 5-like n=1 Tax=Takifugu rubripes TaxID=31033 RepID=UPI0011457E40|nr:nck-associated protein 5-like [Takifugu rubripes]